VRGKRPPRWTAAWLFACRGLLAIGGSWQSCDLIGRRILGNLLLQLSQL